MKRISLYIFVVLFFTLLYVWWFRFTDAFSVQEPLKFWIFFGGFWLLGILVTTAGAVVLGRLIKIDQKKLSEQDIRAIIFGVYFVSFAIGYGLHSYTSLNLAQFLFSEPLTILRLRVYDTYQSLLGMCALGGVLYVIYRIVEVGRHRQKMYRVAKPERKHKLVLIIKLAITGAVIILLALLIQDSEFGRTFKTFQIQLLRGKMENEKDNVIRCLNLENTGISHRTYLKTLQQTCKHLYDAGAKVVVAPIPADLTCSKSNSESIEKITQYGNVVFAVPPESVSDYPGFWVQYPLECKLKIDWGVISAVPLSPGWIAMKYYPLSYRELISGSAVPDVGVQAINRFWGNTDNSEMKIIERTFSLRGFHTGLSKDRSAFIDYQIDPYQYTRTYALVDDQTDSVKFGISDGRMSVVSDPPDSLWRLLEGKIVIIDPGENITKLGGFVRSYSNIMHAILQNKGTIPLDTWTPFIIGIVLLITLCFLIYMKTWLSLPSIVGMIIGQFFLYSWLTYRFNVIVEILPPLVGTILGLFAFSFVLIAHERKEMERSEKKRILEEMQTAHDMQMGLMPTNDPTVPGFDVSGLCHPAFEVGGDYFDYIWLDEGKTKFGIAIADVSGKAMKAAMTAVMTSGMVYREISSRESPRSILKRINRPMYLKTDRRVFTAMSFAVIDVHEKKLSFSNAGQMMPLLSRGNALITIKVEGPRLPLGVMENVEYNEVTLDLQTGDVLVLFTDGMVEAKNLKDELWGFERMEQAIRNLPKNISAKEMAEALTAEANLFAGAAQQHDDMTIVVVKVI